MKLAKLFMLALIPAVLFVLSAGTALAQQGGGISPNKQFGLHANTQGFGAQYAVSPSIQVGGTLNFITGDSPTQLGFTPWVKFLLEGTVNPFVKAGLNISSVETANLIGDTETTTSTGLFGAFGLEYYVNQNFGVYGMVHILDVQLDPSATNFGIFGPVVGVECYFD